MGFHSAQACSPSLCENCLETCLLHLNIPGAQESVKERSDKCLQPGYKHHQDGAHCESGEGARNVHQLRTENVAK